MKRYELNLLVNPDGFQYAIMEYDHFEVREVLINEEPKGEYHVKIKNKSSIMGAVDFFTYHLSGCKVGLVDPSGVLNLEYPIFIITKNEMVIMSIDDTFNDLDKRLSK